MVETTLRQLLYECRWVKGLPNSEFGTVVTMSQQNSTLTCSSVNLISHEWATERSRRFATSTGAVARRNRAVPHFVPGNIGSAKGRIRYDKGSSSGRMPDMLAASSAMVVVVVVWEKPAINVFVIQSCILVKPARNWIFAVPFVEKRVSSTSWMITAQASANERKNWFWIWNSERRLVAFVYSVTEHAAKINWENLMGVLILKVRWVWLGHC